MRAADRSRSSDQDRPAVGITDSHTCKRVAMSSKARARKNGTCFTPLIFLLATKQVLRICCLRNHFSDAIFHLLRFSRSPRFSEWRERVFAGKERGLNMSYTPSLRIIVISLILIV